MRQIEKRLSRESRCRDSRNCHKSRSRVASRELSIWASNGYAFYRSGGFDVDALTRVASCRFKLTIGGCVNSRESRFASCGIANRRLASTRVASCARISRIDFGRFDYRFPASRESRERSTLKFTCLPPRAKTKLTFAAKVVAAYRKTLSRAAVCSGELAVPSGRSARPRASRRAGVYCIHCASALATRCIWHLAC